ncbi:MAG: DUF2190 family protein [Defluviitaleaceae bacterium]|nr:DUF2190 family protein [Defluviitaleaceae bacterium]
MAGVRRFNAMINNSPTIAETLGADMTNVPHRAVMYDTNGNVVLATAGDAAIGVVLSSTMEPLTAGAQVSILIKNIGLVEAGAIIAKGDLLTVNADGVVVPATSGDGIFGRAFTAAGAPGEIIQVQINFMGYAA